MDINWEDLFGKAKDSVKEAWDDVIATGVPALQSSVEHAAIDWLTKQNQSTQAVLESNVNKLLEKKGDSSALGTALQTTVQNTVFKQYGMEIALGVTGLLIAGFFIFRK